MRLAMGFVLAVLLGAMCRMARIPMPAPNAIIGSLLAVAMSSGYVVAGRMMNMSRPGGLTASSVPSEREQPSPGAKPIRVDH